MLTLALAATLIGFGLLVVALITGNFWLAVACIAVCVAGLAVLLWDTLRSSRSGDDGADEPLFTIRDQESPARSAPLVDEAAVESAPAPVVPAASDSGPGESGLGDLVIPPAREATAPVPSPSGSFPAGEVASGDTNDYIKSITGSFPAQSAASGSWPAASMPYAESSAVAQTLGGPDTGPIPASSPYVGRRRRRAGAEPGPFTGGQPVIRTESPVADDRSAAVPPAPPVPPEAPAVPGTPETAPSLISAPPPSALVTDADPIGEEGGTIVVHDRTGPLPKITYVGGDE